MEQTLDTTQLYLDYVRLLDSKSYDCAIRYNVDFSDVRSKASEIFCRVVEEYDPALGKFSTSLYNALRTFLADDVKRDKKKDAKTDSVDEGEEYEDGVVTPDYQYESDRDLMMSAEWYLSEDAKQVLDFLLSGAFEAELQLSVEAPGKRLIEKYIKENWKWPRARRLLALSQIENWYHEEIAA